MSALLTSKVIDEEPGDFIGRHATVIAEFGPATRHASVAAFADAGEAGRRT